MPPATLIMTLSGFRRIGKRDRWRQQSSLDTKRLHPNSDRPAHRPPATADSRVRGGHVGHLPRTCRCRSALVIGGVPLSHRKLLRHAKLDVLQTGRGTPITFTAAIPRTASNEAGAEAFVSFLLSQPARQALSERGLLPPLRGQDGGAPPRSIDSRGASSGSDRSSSDAGALSGWHRQERYPGKDGSSHSGACCGCLQGA